MDELDLLDQHIAAARDAGPWALVPIHPPDVVQRTQPRAPPNLLVISITIPFGSQT
jgi:hypothetical protein